MSADPSPRTLLIAISGPSCSGKTTLARLLRDALEPHAFILHEDDFYKTDAEIPVVPTTDGESLQDWDCLESIDLELLLRELKYIKKHGKLNPDFKSKEDQNVVGAVDVDPETREKARLDGIKLIHSEATSSLRIAIIDGFLLFAEGMKDVRELFDQKFLLRTDYALVKQRREARKGYVTLEGFWEDPPGYVDVIVWPNYVKDHRFLFKDGDVDGDVDQGVVQCLGLHVMPKEAATDMTACFQWAMEKIKLAVQHA